LIDNPFVSTPSIETSSKPNPDDEPMAPQIVTDYDHDKKCFLSDNADGKFTASGLSSKIIFRGAILCMKEEKKKPRNYIQIGSMHVEIG